MYNGDEKLINDGEYLPYSIIDFWKWAYSNLLHNMQRGAFAEFIVKSAIDMNGVHENLSKNTSLAPYDLDGPLIDSLNRPSHIEIKSAASVQTWDIRHPDRLTFSIAPARVPDKNGDYNDCDPKQRNSDMYVFSVYTATDRSTNILDLAWWEFYVCPTRLLDKNYHEQKTISLKKLREFCTPCSFSELFNKISEVCSSISAIEKTK